VSIYESCRNIPTTPVFILNKENFTFIAFCLFFVPISTWCLMSYSYGFPDYFNYVRYVEEGTSFLRFTAEPISAGVMYILYRLDYSAFEFYMVSTALLHISYAFVALKTEKKSRYFVLLFLVFNPINIILIQTPRYAFSMSFGLYAFFARSNSKSIMLILLALLSHNVMGTFVVIFKLTAGMKNHLNFFVLTLCVLTLLLIVNGVIPLGFENFVTSEIQRGVGRVAVFGVFVMYVISAYKGLDDKRLYLLLMAFFMVIIFFITPFTHRVSSFYFVIFAYYLFSQQKILKNRILDYLSCFMFFGVSFYMIFIGGFGYGQ